MTTYTWSANTTTADWTNAGDWGQSVDVFPVPGFGDTALIAYGTVDLAVSPLYDIEITLVQPVSGVTLAAAGVDLGDNTLLQTQAVPGHTKPIVFEVTGSGTLDDSHPLPGLPALAGAIDFAAAPLTIDLDGQASFTNDGSVSGGVLDIATTSDATFVNNTAIDVTGPMTQAAGVTLAGTGVLAIDGIGASANLLGPVAAGQTVEFVNLPANGEIRGGVTIASLANFLGSVLLDRENEIVLPGETSGVQGYANGVLTFMDGATLNVAPAGNASTITTQVVPGAFKSPGETLVEAACFLAGTQIATADGEVPVETLADGDMVRLARGGTARVIWVGRRHVRCNRHPKPESVWPIRIHAGAFAPGVPARDVWLSPDHAVAVAGHLIPVRHLVNGATILQEATAAARYHHIELARHDLVLAEGLAVESYLDTGNRGAFEGGGPALELHPAFGLADPGGTDFGRQVWAEAACLPLAESGTVLAGARGALLRQAARLGYRRTSNSALRVVAGGRALPNASEIGGWLVRLPPGTRSVRLLSRAWVPAAMRPGEADERRLGVALARLWLGPREVSLDSPALTRGWHASEAAGRWTDGDADLATDGVPTLAFTLGMLGTYWREPLEAVRRRACPPA
jgi:hypothetical protein